MNCIILDERKKFLDDINLRMLVDEDRSIEILAMLSSVDKLDSSISELNPDTIVVSSNLVESQENWEYKDIDVFGYAVDEAGEELLAECGIPSYGVVTNTKLLLNLMEGPLPKLKPAGGTKKDKKKPANDRRYDDDDNEEDDYNDNESNDREEDDEYDDRRPVNKNRNRRDEDDEDESRQNNRNRRRDYDDDDPDDEDHREQRRYSSRDDGRRDNRSSRDDDDYDDRRRDRADDRRRNRDYDDDDYDDRPRQRSSSGSNRDDRRSSNSSSDRNRDRDRDRDRDRNDDRRQPSKSQSQKNGSQNRNRDNDNRGKDSNGRKDQGSSKQQQSRILPKQQSNRTEAEDDYIPPKSTAAKKAKVVTVYAAKGGVGKTTIATELAVYLALTSSGRGRLRVCIVDYNIDFGDVRSVLGMPADGPDMSAWALDIRERIEDGENPDEISYTKDEIKDYLQVMDRCKLRALLAPITHEDSMDIGRKELDIMLRNVIENGGFDFVVCDTGNNTRDSSVFALEAADTILLVSTQDATAATCNTSSMEALQKYGLDLRKVRMVINNCMASRITGISVKEVEEAFLYPCIARIPHDASVIRANNLSVPVVYQANHDVTQAIRKIVNYLLDKKAVKTLSPKKASFFKSLFGGK